MEISSLTYFRINSVILFLMLMPINWYITIALSITITILISFIVLFLMINNYDIATDDFLTTFLCLSLIFVAYLFFPTLASVVAILSILSCVFSLILQEWISWLIHYYFSDGENIYHAQNHERIIYFIPIFISFMAFLYHFNWDAYYELKNGNFNKLKIFANMNQTNSINGVIYLFADSTKDVATKFLENIATNIGNIKKSLWLGFLSSLIIDILFKVMVYIYGRFFK